jgi:exonuclease-1
MGVQGLPAELKEGIPRTFLELSGLRGKTLGIDSSVVLYTALRSSPETLAQYFAEPNVPVKAFCASHMKSMLTVLQRAGIKCVWVFDGADHQNKSLVSERRSSSRAQNIADLTLCLQRGNTEDIMNAPKLKSDIMHPRSDIIFEAVEWLKENGQEVVGAPFEADWQLIELELSGKTDGTLTVDSDLFVLGSKCLVLDFKLCKVPNKQEDSATCLIIERQACLRKLEHKIFGAESAN